MIATPINPQKAGVVSIPLVVIGDRLNRVIVVSDRQEDIDEDRLYFRSGKLVLKVSLASIAEGEAAVRKEDEVL